MTARFLIGDVFDRMAELEDGAFDLITCSPPFLALRSYLPEGHPDKAKEIGSEPTPAVFIDTMLNLAAEWRRLLAPHGSIAIELGDTYAGSGGAGGDYDEGGLREDQPKWKQQPGTKSGGRRNKTLDAAMGLVGTTSGERSKADPGGWPLPKSLCGIPQAFMLSLIYGYNVLDRRGPDSPAGQWRIRNVKPWIRTNPPVGALGGKERPATSYIAVACVARDRYFDLDAVRTAPTTKPQRRFTDVPRTVAGQPAQPSDGLRDESGLDGNAAGAPPRDWWHTVDAILDAELYARAKQPPIHRRTKGTQARSGKSAAPERGGNWSSLDEVEQLDSDATGARGHHLRRALERAGILTTLDAYDISPKGYAGAHYAVWPPELVRLLVDEMCPRRVCTQCGEPSRRITVDRSAFDHQPELAAHIKERREALSITSAEINGWFGYKEIAKNWERTDRHGAAIPNPDDWLILAAKLDLDRERFDDLVLGERRWTESTAEYFDQDGRLADKTDRVIGDFQGSGSAGKRDGGITAQRKTLGWSDCGHNTWRPGRILDPFAGTGTTLAVATGVGRDAVGIDIDERNALLASDRVGMFLEIDERPTNPEEAA